MIQRLPEQRPAPARVLYVVYWGLLEPLGQALVLPTVERLAGGGAQITLVSFEKRHTHKGNGEDAYTQGLLAGAGVTWIRLRYHKHPRVPATLFDVLQGWVLGALAARHHGCNIVHARTFVGGLIGFGLARITGSAFVYHNEGFYPDEQVDSGVWRAGSFAHRVSRWLETRLYRSSDGIIALSRRAAKIIRDIPTVGGRNTPILVIPSSVDLRRFAGFLRGDRRPAQPIQFVYSGSIGGRYLFGDVARFLATALEALPASSLTILSWAARGDVAAALRKAGVPDAAWSLRCVPHREMPRELPQFDVGLHFAVATSGGAGGSPTKVGEYWASGLPVVATPGQGDLDEIIQTERVGVLLLDDSTANYRRAIRELEDLLSDPQLAERCRAAAEAHYDLDLACSKQLELYERLRTQGRVKH